MNKFPVRFQIFLMIFVITGLFFAFVGIEKATAQGLVYYTNCATSGEDTTSIGIPATAPQIHVPGNDFTPEDGDEFAVFRPVGGSCSPVPNQCAGAVLWEETATSFSVFGSSDGADGSMIPGEEMCWRVYDTSASQEYMATVVYDPSAIGVTHWDGIYGHDRVFALASLIPTAIDHTDFSARNDSWLLISSAAVLLGLVFLAGVSLYFSKIRSNS